ncbi:MAG TPA: polysaccharide deacetylase family protein [Symbiobacteriaceae bacterium]|nr:polysaccharide deacetylase family protein [Symbiobacteriaceae bacterium]
MSRIWLWLLPAIVLIAIPAAGIASRETDPELLARHAAQAAVRRGDRGEAVTALQRVLKDTGFDPGKVDGIFGPLTEAAVRRAQKALGARVDGLAGRETVSRLTQTDATARTLLFTRDAKAPSATLVLNLAERPAPTRKEQFALTFNGVPDPDLLPQLLATLKAHDMQATFFIYGETAERSPELVARIAEAGHEIGHGGPAAAADMTSLRGRALEQAVQRTQEQIARAAGRAPAVFRPPLGRFDGPVAEAAAGAGLSMALWTNVGAGDHPALRPDDLASRLYEEVYPGAVLMLHQDRPSTVAALELLLVRLAGEGYRSVGLSALSER